MLTPVDGDTRLGPTIVKTAPTLPCGPSPTVRIFVFVQLGCMRVEQVQLCNGVRQQEAGTASSFFPLF